MLTPLIDHGKGVVEEVRGAAFARTEARLDVRAWKENVNAIRLANFGELVALWARCMSVLRS